MEWWLVPLDNVCRTLKLELDYNEREALYAMLANDKKTKQFIVGRNRAYFFRGRALNPPRAETRYFSLILYNLLPSFLKSRIPGDVRRIYEVAENGMQLKRAVKPFVTDGNFNRLYNLCFHDPFLNGMLERKIVESEERCFVPIPPDSNVYKFRARILRLLDSAHLSKLPDSVVKEYSAKQ